MPYSKAHYFLLGLIVITVLAFWNSYFGVIDKAPVAHHFHGITSTFWILLIAFQSWLIHNNKRNLHRQFGKLLFLLIPMMIGAFALVTLVGAQKSVAQHPFYLQFGQALLTSDALLTVMTAVQVYLALRFRSNVRLHSALMIGTLIGLLAPIFARLLPNFIPQLEITDLDTMYRFGYSIHISQASSTLIGLSLFTLYKKEGWPWLLAVAIVLSSWLLYATFGQSQVWQNWVYSIAKLNPYFVYIGGFVFGLLACTLGWKHGKPVSK